MGASGGQPAVGADPRLSAAHFHALWGLKEIMECADDVDYAVELQVLSINTRQDLSSRDCRMSTSLAIGITLGVLGGGLFGTGLLLSMEPLTVTGIVLLIITIVIFCIIFLKKPIIVPEVNSTPIRVSNSMKRNKSDTDLELMRQESEV